MLIKKKIKTGSELINQGMTLLTQATDAIEDGVELNAVEVAQNNTTIADLRIRNEALDNENNKAMKVVKNFKKNILGE